MGDPNERNARVAGKRDGSERVESAALGRLALVRRVARWVMVLERAGTLLWPVFGLSVLFLVLAFLDVLPALGGLLHLGVLIGLVAALIWAVRRGIVSYHSPERLSVDRRLEEVNDLRHRPLESLADDLVSDPADPASAVLWHAHRQRVMRAIRSLGVGWPRPMLAKADPFALRGLLAVSLVVGLVVANGNYGDRIVRALIPDLAADTTPETLDLWVSPPAYTQLPPRLLAQGMILNADTDIQDAGSSGEKVKIPGGSTVLAQVQGGEAAPVLRFGDRQLVLDVVGPGSYRLEAEVKADAVASEMTLLREKERLASWPIEIVPDLPPEVDFAREPMQTERGTLRLDYRASDDYSIAEVGAEIRLEDQPAAEPISLPLALPGISPKEAEAVSYHDLTAHPWAGLPVLIRFTATDVIGQLGESGTRRILLPERMFTHPVAKEIIALRKLLTKNPANRRGVARGLDEIARRPGAFEHDVSVFLALRMMSVRLVRGRDEGLIVGIQSLMWDTALHIEDGRLSVAERALRDAEQALLDALAGDASDEEIERLMDELQRAMDEYLNALAEQLMDPRMQQQMQQMPPNEAANMLQRQDLQDMLDQIRELAKSGAREAARQMLAQMREMMANMRAGMMQQGNPGNQEAWQMLQDLQELARQQQELMDRTFGDSDRSAQQPGMQGLMPPMPGQQGQQGQPGQMGQQGQQGQQGMSGLSQQQEALRRQLGDLMRRMGERMGNIPGPLGRAEREMKGAVGALSESQADQAVHHQGQALDQLREGAQSYMEQLSQQMQQQQGPGQPGQGPQASSPPNRDPFGRQMRNTGGVEQGGIDIPDGWDLQRSRAILEELRRRAADPMRPVIEKDYLERLLRRF